VSNKKQRKIYQYNAIFQQEDDGGYSVWVPSLPGCTSQGDTFEEAVSMTKEAISLFLNVATIRVSPLVIPAKAGNQMPYILDPRLNLGMTKNKNVSE
jgi:predicted RNase H-like HicB family nuclease